MHRQSSSYRKDLRRQSSTQKNEDARRTPSFSVDGDAGPAGHEVNWQLSDFRQNLVSILNDPQAPKAEKELYYKDWGTAFTGETVPSSSLPKITRSDFDDYLSAVPPALHARLARRGAEASRRGEESQGPTSMGDGADEAVETDLDRLSHIPEIFFQKSFSLDDPKTFNLVVFGVDSAASDETGAHSRRHQHSNDKKKRREETAQELKEYLQRQEELSHHLDEVELQLAQRISQRSDAFFRCLKSQQDLHKEVMAGTVAIATVRRHLRTADQQLTHSGLKVAQLVRRRNNVIELYKKLKLVATLSQTQATVQMLLSSSDFAGALDLLSRTQEVLDTELAGVHSFRHLGDQLAETARTVQAAMMSEFHTSALDVVANMATDTAKDRLGPQIAGLVRARSTAFLDDYRTALYGKLKCIIKDTCEEFITTLLRQMGDRVTVADSGGSASSAARDGQAQTVTLSDQMRKMEFGTWLEMMLQLFGTLSGLLENVSAVHAAITEVLLQVLDEEKGSEGRQSDQEKSRPSAERASTPDKGGFAGTKGEYGGIVIRESADIVCGAAEVMHVRMAKLLALRAEQTAKLSYEQFRRLFGMVEEFVAHTDATVPRSTPGLKGELVSMAKAWLNQYHRKKKNQLQVMVDNERWVPADVAHEFQVVVDSLCQFDGERLPESSPSRPFGPSASSQLRSSSSKPESDASGDRRRDLAAGGSHPEPAVAAMHSPATLRRGSAPIADGTLRPASPGRAMGAAGGQSEPHLYVDGQGFTVVGCVLMFLQLLQEYCRCAVEIPALATDVLQSTMDLLKFFNSRTYQLILGAGAIEIAGLKTITAKHLALASQCLTVVQWCMPHLKRALAVNLTDKQRLLLNEMDRVSKDYTEHQKEIVKKFIEIMEAVLARYLSKSIKWEAELTEEASPYMRNIMKETAKLHKVLFGILPPAQLNDVFSEVFKLFTARFQKEYMGVNLSSTEAQKRLTADARYFADSAGQLEGVKGPGHDLEKYVEDIITQANTQAVTATAPKVQA